MSIFTFNFKKQFAPLVESGEKRQTVRATRKDHRIPKVGDVAKCYTGLRTAQTRLLMVAPIVQVSTVLIDFNEHTLSLDSGRLNATHSEAFAHADGFASFAQLLEWFRATHNTDPNYFEGFFTRWEPTGASAP